MKYFGWLVLAGIFVGATTAYADCDVGTSDNEVKGCLAQELRDSDKRINAVYKAVLNNGGDNVKISLRNEQRSWIKKRDKVCHLDERESDREKWLSAILSDQVKTVCVVRYTFQRVSELNDMLGKMNNAPIQLPTAPQAPKFLPAASPDTETKMSDGLAFIDDGYRADSTSSHEKSKWYFEIRIEPGSIARLGDVVLISGVQGTDGHGDIKTFNIRRKSVDAAPFIAGFAVDLDNGFFYFRKNGVWDSNPSSNTGLSLKLNRKYTAYIEGSSSIVELMKQNLIKINLGEKPFKYTLPDGYRPFGEH